MPGYLTDQERRDIEANIPSAATRDAMWSLGTAAIVATVSYNEKVRLEKLDEGLRTTKRKWYFDYTIVGITCSSCHSETEEGQWHCHVCSSPLT